MPAHAVADAPTDRRPHDAEAYSRGDVGALDITGAHLGSSTRADGEAYAATDAAAVGDADAPADAPANDAGAVNAPADSGADDAPADSGAIDAPADARASASTDFGADENARADAPADAAPADAPADAYVPSLRREAPPTEPIV